MQLQICLGWNYLVTDISSIKYFGHTSVFCDCEKSATTVCPPRPKLCRLPTKSHQSHRQHYYFAGILCHLCNIYYHIAQSHDHIISFYATLATIVIQKEMKICWRILRSCWVVGILQSKHITHNLQPSLFNS